MGGGEGLMVPFEVARVGAILTPKIQSTKQSGCRNVGAAYHGLRCWSVTFSGSGSSSCTDGLNGYDS